jgi:hypothetical protein
LDDGCPLGAGLFLEVLLVVSSRNVWTFSVDLRAFSEWRPRAAKKAKPA